VLSGSRGARGSGSPSASVRALRAALGSLWVTASVLAGVETALFAAEPSPPWVVYLFPAVAAAYATSGVIAWGRRPSNGMGPVLYLGGLVILLAGLLNTSVPALAAAGLVLAAAPIGAVFHALLAFPSGRLNGRVAAALVALGYVITIALQSPRYLFSRNPPPLDAFELGHRPTVVHAGILVQNISGGVVLACGALLLAHRVLRASTPQRRVLGPVYLYGIAAILFLELAAHVLRPLFGIGPNTVFGLQMAGLAGVPAAFVSGILRGGFARSGELEELGVWLGSTEGGRPGLRDALAATLGDPSLELLFWLPDGGYVSAAGEPVCLPRLGSGRAAVEVELADQRIGAIAYDGGLIADPELVRAGGRVIAIALERERLTAALLASRESLRESRVRIIEAADRERRRIARDLHDGLQGRLVTVAIRTGRLAADPAARTVASELTGLREELEEASGELRDLVQGVMPALLLERGLYAATEDLVDRLPVPTRLALAPGESYVPLPQRIESTGYFVVAEALTNAVKHSQARELGVTVARDDSTLRIEVTDDGVGGASVAGGSGLRGIADRLDVLGGTLHIRSPEGQGTWMLAELPCAS
jgi:signal transduction histidine kinase